MNKIVIVDDSPIMVEGIKFIIESSTPYSVIDTFRNGREFLDAIEELDFDILITDLEMPEVTGYEIIEKLKSLDAKIHVVVITNHVSQQTIVELKGQGVIEVVDKKYVDTHLIEALQRILED